jgi:protocatechuate 3,4-dioxygenase beta subunit
LRGHQFTDGRGRFRLVTVVPGLYPGRTRHIHVKAQRPRGEILTTQLYFKDEPANDSDGIFDPALVMVGDRRSARFDFVLA